MPHTCQDGVLKPQIAISLSPEPAGSQAEHPNWKCWDYLSHLMISKLHQSPPSPSRKLWVMSCLQHSPARGKEKALSLFPSPLCLIPASQTSFLTPLPKRQQLALLQGAVQSTTRWYREESTIPKKTPKKPTHKVPNVGLQEQRHNRQPWAGCARWESQKMGNRSEQHTAEGLCFTQKHPTKVMGFFLLNWHLMAFKRPQQQIEKEKKKLLGKSECSKEWKGRSNPEFQVQLQLNVNYFCVSGNGLAWKSPLRWPSPTVNPVLNPSPKCHSHTSFKSLQGWELGSLAQSWPSFCYWNFS